jgi:hypothetical protein
MDNKIIRIKNESDFKRWFEKNFRKLGYLKIIKKDSGIFPDYIMLRRDKEVGVELETLLSNFLLHKHNLKDVDEIVCVEKDIKIKKPVIKARGLMYESDIVRVSATVNEETSNFINILLKKGSKYRNKSHVIESAIKLLKKDEEKNEKK